MTREEQKEKKYYVQMSNTFFEDKQVQKLLATSAGDTIFRIYMQLWCKSLDAGGTLPLDGDMPTAEELAIIIGLAPLKKLALDRWQAEVKVIESAVEICREYKLIEVREDKIVFPMTEDYTRSWTKDAIDRKQKRDADVSTDEDKSEKTEKTPSNRAKAQIAADEMFERLWKQYPRKKGKERVKPATKYRLYKGYGEERCQKALDAYKTERVGKDQTYTLYGCNFFNKDIFDYLDGDATQPAQPARPMTAAQAESLAMSLGILNSGRWNRDAYASIRDSLTDAQRQAIDSVIN